LSGKLAQDRYDLLGQADMKGIEDGMQTDGRKTGTKMQITPQNIFIVEDEVVVPFEMSDLFGRHRL